MRPVHPLHPFHRFPSAFLFACLAMLAACGGGSSASPTGVAAGGSTPEVATPAAPAAPAGPPVYPAATRFEARPLEAFMALPGYLEPTEYPPTGTILTRITDAAAFGVDARVMKHDYARRAVWNADGSRMLLVRPYPARILDTADLRRVEVHQTPADPLWSNTDPDAIYGLVGGRSLVRYSVSTRTSVTLHTFEGYRDLSIGGSESVQSDDDRYFVLVGDRDGGIDVIVYDRVADGVSRIAFEGLSGADEDIDWAGISPGGGHVVVKLDTKTGPLDPGFLVYDRATLALRRTLLVGSDSHADIGIDQAGHEVLVSTTAESPAIVSARLSDGTVREELSAQTVAFNTHVSCRNRLRPGWCYVSTYPESSGREAHLYRSVFSVKLDGSGQVERFAPAFFADGPADITYERQAWAVPNPRGDQVVFSSDWGDASDDAVVQTYLVRARR